MSPVRKTHKAPPGVLPARAAAATTGEDGEPLGFIPADPVDHRLTIDGVVCGADGKVDIEAYEDIMQSWAGEPPPQSHPDPTHPGVRPGEEIPKGLRVWDDLRSGSTSGGKAKDGAGWIAATKTARLGKREKWFNIRTCGSWRLAFLLARLQRALWAREDMPTIGMGLASESAVEAAPVQKVTPMKRQRKQDSPETSPKQRKLARKASAEGSTKSQEESISQPAAEESASSGQQQKDEPKSKLNSVLDRIRARVKDGA